MLGGFRTAEPRRFPTGPPARFHSSPMGDQMNLPARTLRPINPFASYRPDVHRPFGDILLGSSIERRALRCRYLVIGSGVAGLHTAWRASLSGDVVLLTKRSLFDSATAYAQGGIAAAIGAGDSPELHQRDTLAAGAAMCDRAAVDVLVHEGPARVRELRSAGVHFDLDPRGEFLLGKEAAHSERRI